MTKVKVLFVCLGNICRSPTAEGVFRKHVADRGWSDRVAVDSAGTSGWHQGEPCDPRAREEAARRGIDLSAIRSRGVRPSDFEDFDYIVAMDSANLRELKRMAPRERLNRIHRCTDFAPGLGVADVPDPY